MIRSRCSSPRRCVTDYAPYPLSCTRTYCSCCCSCCFVWSAGQDKVGVDSKVRIIEGHMHRAMSKKQREEQDRRYVILCASEMRPISMSSGAAFQYFIGGLSPSYVSQTIHQTTIDRHLDALFMEVKTAITVKLQEHVTSVRKMGWYGPCVSAQVDLTTANNVEYATMSLSWVPQDWSEMERVTVCTKAFPGRHTQEELEPWLRKVSFTFFYFYFLRLLL